MKCPPARRFQVHSLSPASTAWLDWIRAAAALAVFIQHARYFSFPPVPAESAGMKLFNIVAGCGHEAVIVFFVLSGFLVGGSALKEISETGTLQIRRYLFARVARIHSVLVPALLLGGGLDWLGIHWLNDSALYEGARCPAAISWNVSESLSLGGLVANLLCLQNIMVPVFGCNGPLWSLANEFWYYFLFPALLMGCWPSTPWFKRLIALLAAVGLFWLLGVEKSLYFGIWLFGVVVRVMSPRWSPSSGVGLAGWIGTLLILETSLGNPLQLDMPWKRSLTVATGFAICLLSLANHPMELGRRTAVTGRHLAGCSYTLYACHYPLLAFANAVCGTRFGIELPAADGISAGGWFLVMLPLGFGACWGISRVTEQKHHRLRDWLLELSRGRPTAARTG